MMIMMVLMMTVMVVMVMIMMLVIHQVVGCSGSIEDGWRRERRRRRGRRPYLRRSWITTTGWSGSDVTMISGAYISLFVIY